MINDPFFDGQCHWDSGYCLDKNHIRADYHRPYSPWKPLWDIAGPTWTWIVRTHSAACRDWARV